MSQLTPLFVLDTAYSLQRLSCRKIVRLVSSEILYVAAERNPVTKIAALDYDLVVLGSGVAGLTAALTAALADLRVLVLEHENLIGGTSARSSGTVWVPGNHYLDREVRQADLAAAETYLASLIGGRGDERMWRTFLNSAPRMIADLDKRAGIVFRPYLAAPDYRQDHPGAADGGRPLEPLPFDGRLLGADFDRLAWPLRELMVFGGMMVTRAEAANLLTADRSASAMRLGILLVLRYLADRLRYRRGTRLVLGNALVARLYKALIDCGVTIRTNATPRCLVRRHGKVESVEVTVAGEEASITARWGVVLAGGGFPASPEWRARYLPAPVAQYTPASPGCDGSTIALARSIGAALGTDGSDNALWFPSSIATRRDGSTAVYPHIVLDRSKPGLIAVNAAGQRFTNEAVSYHEFVRAMYRAHREVPAIPAWLICDRAFIRRYGLGLIRPRTPSLRKYVANGYLYEASTVSQLAERIGMPAEALQATVTHFNEFAIAGVDAEFGKGETIYDRSNGDPRVAPNPCLGPIETAPFYALPVLPTPLGTSRGLLADPDARVLDEEGLPIEGLYVCGNDMQSAFGGEYPGAGAQLGQAMTFGWIAARHAVQATDRDHIET